MTAVQEMVSVLFDNETISKVKQQFKAGNQKVPIDSRNINFRLFKRNYGNITLELLCRDSSGIYFKPIGYYEFEKGGFFSSGKLSITILKEFEEDYIELKKSNKLDDHGIKVNLMDMKESGLIAAFSKEAIENIKVMYKQKKQGVSQEVADLIGPFPHLHAMQFDKSIMSNGLKIDLLFSMDGFPQSYLDDEYEVEGGFGAYFQDEKGLEASPTVEHKVNYDRFYKMGLLSGLNND